jgi:hypothetical protein
MFGINTIASGVRRKVKNAFGKCKYSSGVLSTLLTTSSGYWGSFFTLKRSEHKVNCLLLFTSAWNFASSIVYLKYRLQPLCSPVSPGTRSVRSDHGGSATRILRHRGTAHRSAPWTRRCRRSSLSVWRHSRSPAPAGGRSPSPRRCSIRPRTPDPRLQQQKQG